jgi:hypothetical protein
VDEATLRERLAGRTDNDLGKTEYELQTILGWHAAMAENCLKFGIEPRSTPHNRSTQSPMRCSFVAVCFRPCR